MIRIALVIVGFVSVTIALLTMQPNPTVEPTPVTRAATAPLPVPEIRQETDATLANLRRVTGVTPAPTQEPMRNAIEEAVQSTLDDVRKQDDMRELTFSVLRDLDRAKAKDVPIGAPGSLLHSLVQRSAQAIDEQGLTDDPYLQELREMDSQ